MAGIESLGSINIGDYEEIPFVDTLPDGSPNPLTGKTIQFTAKRDFSATAALAEKSSEIAGEIVVTDGAAGAAKVVLDGSEEGLLALKQDATLCCDIQVIDAQDRKNTTRYYLRAEKVAST